MRLSCGKFSSDLRENFTQLGLVFVMEMAYNSGSIISKWIRYLDDFDVLKIIDIIHVETKRNSFFSSYFSVSSINS